MWKMNNKLKCIFYLQVLRVYCNKYIFFHIFRQPHRPLHLDYNNKCKANLFTFLTKLYKYMDRGVSFE